MRGIHDKLPRAASGHDQLTARKWNETQDRINDTSRKVFESVHEYPRRPVTSFIASITNKGPNNEADWTDERYWLVECDITGVDANRKCTFATVTGGLWVTATNEAEAVSGSHSLDTNWATSPYVRVEPRMIDGANVGYVFSSGGSGAAQTAYIGKIATHAGDYTDERYYVKLQRATTVSGNKPTLVDGDEVTAVNIAELSLSAAYKHLLLVPKNGTHTGKDRYVIVFQKTAADGNTWYAFNEPPVQYVEDEYAYCPTSVDTNDCPDAGNWYKGLIPMGVTDARQAHSTNGGIPPE
jgi:hypothetical protein